NPEDPYGRCVFFRPLELSVNGDAHAGRRVPLSPGDAATLRLGFYNPHLSEDDVARHELRVLAPEDALTVAAPARFPATGEVEVELEARGSDPTLTVQIGPAPAEHTSVTMRFAAAARQEERTSTGWELRDAAVSKPTLESLAGAVASQTDILRSQDT